MRRNDEPRMTKDEGMTKAEAQMSKRKHRRTRSSFKPSSFLIRHFALTVSLLLPLSARAQAPPSAIEILASVGMMESSQQIDLQGQLRQANVVFSFYLVQSGPLIRYSFAHPYEILQLRLLEYVWRLDLFT